jgi:hypothetical protein
VSLRNQKIILSLPQLYRSSVVLSGGFVSVHRIGSEMTEGGGLLIYLPCSRLSPFTYFLELRRSSVALRYAICSRKSGKSQALPERPQSENSLPIRAASPADHVLLQT